MPDPDPPTVRLPTAEAATRLGLTPAGVRSRVRRGSLRAEHGSSGQLLVEVPLVARSVMSAAPEEAEGTRWRRPVARRSVTTAARSGSTPPPLIVTVAAVLIGSIVLAY